MLFRNITRSHYSQAFLTQAPRHILEEEVTARLSSSSDTIILQTPPVPPRVSIDPPYERIFLLDPQYQDPAVLRNKLPELSQSAESSGTHAYYHITGFYNRAFKHVLVHCNTEHLCPSYSIVSEMDRFLLLKKKIIKKFSQSLLDLIPSEIYV